MVNYPPRKAITVLDGGRVGVKLKRAQMGLKAAWDALAGRTRTTSGGRDDPSDWDARRAPGADTGWKARGFGEGTASRPILEKADALPRAPMAYPRRDQSDQRASGAALPFPSIGPHGHRQRLRKRLLERGAESLADYELLEMLLFFAFKTGDTKPFAKQLISRYGSVAALLTAPTRDLLATPGLGEHSVSAIRLVQALSAHLAQAQVREQPVLNSWDRLIEYLTIVMAHERIEHFRVLFLDPKNRLIADEAQARGTVNHTPVYPREVVKRALELHATALILVHNHPSGDPTPSPADIQMTAEVKAAASVLGIALHDHLIIGKGQHTSLRREGLL